MLLHLAGMILLSLHTADSQGSRKTQPKAIVVSPGTEVTINCSLPSRLSGPHAVVPWFKEDLNGSLRMIYKASLYNNPHGKYSSPLNTSLYGSLTISNVQRNYSGVYYCITTNPFEIHQRTRLIVKHPSRPTFSILAPSVLPEDQLDCDIPLLCLIIDANPAWKTVSWDIDGETFQVPKDVDTIDENGVFSIWSLKLVPPKEWTQRANDSCSVLHNRTVSAGDSTNTGNCNHVLHFGVPGIVILFVIQSFVLLFRKHLARGKVEQPASQVHMRVIPQTDYAELRYNS